MSHRAVSGAHRTVRCDSGATATSRATVDCNALKARLRAQKSEQAPEGAPDSLQDLSGAPPDCPVDPPVRAPMVEPIGLVTWLAHRTVSGGAPDCPVRHATAAFQRPLCGGWGYKYPNHPTFKSSKFSTFQLLTRASIQYKTHQRDQILSQLHTKL